MMKKHLPVIAGILLGLLFLMASIMFFLGVGPKEPPPEGTPAAHFMAAMGPTGYFAFIKVFELVGGLLVMVPRLRNFGLLLLGPVIVNIVAFHVFIGNPRDLLNPMVLVMLALALYLLWVGRRGFAGLLKS